MKHLNALLIPACLVALFLLNSCSSTNQQPSSAFRAAPVTDYTGWAPTVSRGMQMESVAMAPSVSAPAPLPPEDRPGLGTATGREVYQEFGVTAGKFYRYRQNEPDAVALFAYNDVESAKVLAEMDGRTTKHRGWFKLAGGFLEARLVSGSSSLPWYATTGGTIVIGENGSTYAIELRNKAKERVEAVVSVDGLNVDDGQPAYFTKRGYILSPGKTIRIEGFRSGSNLVKQFRFSTVGGSLAVQSGGTLASRNVGVIGVAMWREDERAARQDRLREGQWRSQANPFPGATR